jgi:hypothetical protein
MVDEIEPELVPGTTRECLDPWVYIEFNVNGDVRPCCVREGIGNLEHSSLVQILNGTPGRALRTRLLTGDLDRQCTNCRIRPAVPIAKFHEAVRKALDKVTLPEDFVPERYLDANPDVRAAGADAVQHFKLSGRFEGRKTKPDWSPERRQFRFDPDQYLEANPDVAGSNMDPWEHFLQVGQFEGRRLRVREPAATPVAPPPVVNAVLAAEAIMTAVEAGEPEGSQDAFPELNVKLRLPDLGPAHEQAGQSIVFDDSGEPGSPQNPPAVQAELEVLSYEHFKRQDGFFADIYTIEIKASEVVPNMTIKARGDDIADLQFEPLDTQVSPDRKIGCGDDHWYVATVGQSGRYKVSVITRNETQIRFQYAFEAVDQGMA